MFSLSDGPSPSARRYPRNIGLEEPFGGGRAAVSSIQRASIPISYHTECIQYTW
jgi:hypothetical protein